MHLERFRRLTNRQQVGPACSRQPRLPARAPEEQNRLRLVELSERAQRAVGSRVAGMRRRRDEHQVACPRRNGTHGVVSKRGEARLMRFVHDDEIPELGGHAAKLWKRPREITLLFESEPGCAPPRCPFFGQEGKLTMRARCDTESACDDAWLSLQSVRFW